jgi:hypothetical protein
MATTSTERYMIKTRCSYFLAGVSDEIHWPSFIFPRLFRSLSVIIFTTKLSIRMSTMTMSLLSLVFFISLVYVKGNSLVTGKASFTYYNSYPFCCPNSPNYDPTAPSQECTEYSGCDYIGDFAAFVNSTNVNGYRSFPFIQGHNLIAFYDNHDPKGSSWFNKYAGKTIKLTKVYKKQVHSFNATIADTCSNSDCSNCCTTNSGSTGYLVDMEYYTVMNNFGNTDAVSGSIEFEIYDFDGEIIATSAASSWVKQQSSFFLLLLSSCLLGLIFFF